jgi:hypothetical protein
MSVILGQWPDRSVTTARHEKAAANHERSAAFWEGQGDVTRADLQRDLARHEREGAALERRWAKLIESAEPDGRRPDEGAMDNAALEDREADVEARQIELEIQESEVLARERASGTEP